MESIKRVTKIIQLTLIMFIMCLTFSINQIVIGECTNSNNCHTDTVVHRCLYTQEDLQRAYKKTPERYKKTNCFYCGCSIKEHTSAQ